ncbi:CsbD family protein [Nitrospira sp. M1]
MERPKFAAGSLALLLIVGMANISWSGFRAHQMFSEQSGSGNPFETLVLNEDQFKGSWKQFKGELKQEWGEFTDDDLLEIEGDKDKFEGKLQERYGDRKEELREWTDKWFEQHTFEAQTEDRMHP